jgi:hypothetical protein
MKALLLQISDGVWATYHNGNLNHQHTRAQVRLVKPAKMLDLKSETSSSPFLTSVIVVLERRLFGLPQEFCPSVLARLTFEPCRWVAECSIVLSPKVVYFALLKIVSRIPPQQLFVCRVNTGIFMWRCLAVSLRFSIVVIARR